MTNDFVFRAVCIALAMVLWVAPHREKVKEAARWGIEKAKEWSHVLARIAIIGLLLAAGGVFDRVVAARWLDGIHVPAVSIDPPSDAMKAKVSDVAAALARVGAGDRAIWANTWEKAAAVVAAPEGQEPVFTDTRSLRLYTVLALDIAWRRLGNHQPGDVPGLRAAVEKVLGEVVGMEVKPVTPELRRSYAEACRAIAWAGVGGG